MSQEQEITENDFYKIIEEEILLVMGGGGRIASSKIFKLSEKRTEQQIYKILNDAKMSLPNDDEKEAQYSKRFPHWKSIAEESDRAEIYQEGVEWGLDKASKVISIIEKQWELERTALGISYDENNKSFRNIIAEKDKQIQEMMKDVIGFKNWCDKLTPTELTTVHHPDGSGCGYGLYELTTEQLYSKYQYIKKQ